MKHHFKIAAEFFDTDGETDIISAGSFRSVAAAHRAARQIGRWAGTSLKDRPHMLPASLEEVAALYEDGARIEIALYAVRGGDEEWLMSFDAMSKEPISVTPDAELLWPILKEGLKR